MSRRDRRSLPEKISLVASIAVLIVVVALIAVQIPGGEEPAAPIATVERVRPVGSTFHVDVEVHNAGERTAANVQVMAELSVGGRSITGDQVIDFLSGGERRALTFVFDTDPAAGALEIAVSGYAEP